MERYAGGVAKYRAADGTEVLVPSRSAVADTVQEILGARALRVHVCRRAAAAGILETGDVRARDAAGERGVRQG